MSNGRNPTCQLSNNRACPISLKTKLLVITSFDPLRPSKRTFFRRKKASWTFSLSIDRRNCLDIAKEKTPQLVKDFNTDQLNHVKTNEKNSLPTGGDIALEKTPQLVKDFDHSKLHHVETTVKSHLPDGEEYAREKVKSEASNFDHSKLHHVEPNVKTNVEIVSEQ
ncbi:hypothetical protein M3Y98_00806500 [Aphelenchoides besseyi]|nr:hypothetical protein M3Y98_00806500 [Aphelenchoides besseyi]KAI6212089.1 hypothetical protein M3Y96_00503400 [Aphelenchoides besseyi]